MTTRKEMKRKAKKAVKKHYILYVAVCLIMAYMGVEFSSSLNVLDITPAEEVYRMEDEERLTRIGANSDGLIDVIADLLAGDQEGGQELSSQIKEEEKRSEEVKEYEEYVKTDDYIKETAEQKLGLVDPNEIIFKPSR